MRERVALVTAFFAGAAAGLATGWLLWVRQPSHSARVSAARSSAETAAAPSASVAPKKPPPPAERPWTAEDDELKKTLKEQRHPLFRKMKLRLRLSEESLAKVREIFEKSAWLGQGNPEATEHPMTRAECRAIRKKAGLRRARKAPQYTKR